MTITDRILRKLNRSGENDHADHLIEVAKAVAQAEGEPENPKNQEVFELMRHCGFRSNTRGYQGHNGYGADHDPCYRSKELGQGIAPGNVEIGGAALLALSSVGSGADSTKGKQRHKESYHTIDRFASDRNGGCGQSLGRGFGQL